MTPGAVSPGAAGRPEEDAATAEPPAGRRFRANPRYELVLFDRLAPAERRALARLREQPDFYGVLRPLGPLEPRKPRKDAAGLSVKAVDRETALLLLTLREPGPLPAYLAEVLGAASGRTVARLVADGVLEVESRGSFVSGPAALGLLSSGPAGGAAPGGGVSPAGTRAGGRLAELSLAALRWAALLPVDDPVLLAARLYAYNRRPLTPRWARSLPGEAAVRAYLKIDEVSAGRSGSSAAGVLLASWDPVPARGSWLVWAARGASPRPPGPTFKLYLSPQPEALPAVFAEALTVLPRAGAGRLKVGSDAAGVLRPDKLVAYFAEIERLAAAAEALAARLAGAPAQGVPFTAEIAGDGLLSWGAEPPRSRRLPGGRESWRLWLANRLARSLVEARAGQMATGGAGPEEQATTALGPERVPDDAAHSVQPATGAPGHDLAADGAGSNLHPARAGVPAAGAQRPEPWRFALERLRLDGVDTETWAPGALFWTGG